MKKSLGRFIFLSKIISFVFTAGLFLFCLNILPVKAAVTSFTAYYLITADATPTIRGTIATTDAANTHITVTIYDMYDVEKFTKEYTAAVDGNTWSVEVAVSYTHLTLPTNREV